MQALHKHLKLHIGGTSDCPYCEKKFTENQALKAHLQVHGMVDRDQICPFDGCGKAFYRKSDVNRHHKEVHLGMRKQKIKKLETE